jgi:hypothetical protein
LNLSFFDIELYLELFTVLAVSAVFFSGCIKLGHQGLDFIAFCFFVVN